MTVCSRPRKEEGGKKERRKKKGGKEEFFDNFVMDLELEDWSNASDHAPRTLGEREGGGKGGEKKRKDANQRLRKALRAITSRKRLERSNVAVWGRKGEREGGEDQYKAELRKASLVSNLALCYEST